MAQGKRNVKISQCPCHWVSSDRHSRMTMGVAMTQHKHKHSQAGHIPTPVLCRQRTWGHSEVVTSP
jgi:hypothetical protein